MKAKFLQTITIIVLIILFSVSTAKAATYYSVATGNWAAASTWSTTSGGVAGAVGVPATGPIAGDVVFIEGGFTVTVAANAACTSVQLGHTGATASAGTLTFSNSATLNVSGAVLVGNNISGSNGTITFTSGSTLNAGSLTLSSATNGVTGTITMTLGGTLSLGGAITLGAGNGTKTWTPGTGTVIFTGSNTLPATIFTTFNNLQINGGTTTTAVNLTAIANLTIGASGAFATAAAHTITATSILVNGTYNNVSTGLLTVTNLTVNGTWNHASTSATLPKGSATTSWAVNSNLNITGTYTTATVFANFIGQTFGNFTFSPTSMTNTVSLIGASGTTTIAGNFTITSTGSNTLYMRISGQQFAGVININGNFSMAAGIFDMHNGGATPTVEAINLKGNFTLSGTSLLTQTTTQAGSTVNFNFVGTTTQVVSIAPTTSITSQATTASCAIQFTVASGSTIDMGTSVLTGTNNTSFLLNAGANIITANTGGLALTGATGSIQVAGPRTYSTSANYTYNSLVATQVTGSGVIGANNLTFNNTFSTGVTYSNAIAASGTVTVAASAHVNLGTYTSSASALILGSSTQAVGTSYGSTSSAAATKNDTYFGSSTGILNINLPPPSNLSYTSPFAFPLNVAITQKDPTVTGIVTSWAISPALPTGLNFNTSTGAITGTPTLGSPSNIYTVTATNSAGSTTFGIVMSVGNYRYAISSANWNVNGTWSATSGGSTCGCIPASGDIVFISEAATAYTVTIPSAYAAACGSLTMGNYSAATIATLTLTDGTSTLTIDNDLVMNRPNAAATTVLNVNAGNLIVGGILRLANSDLTPNAGATLIDQLNISTGTVTLNDLLFNGQAAAQSQIVFSGAGTLNIRGNITFGYALGTLTPSTGTVNFNGTTVAQTIPLISAVSYNNITVNNTNAGGATLGAATTAANVLGNITVGNLSSGSLLNTGNFAMTFGASKTLTDAAASTLNAGTSVISFGTTGAVAINGTFKTANLVAFSGSATGAINSTNTPGITLGTASTIEYNAATTQPFTLRTDYANVTLTGGSKTIPIGTTTLSKNLSINTGATYNGAANPTLNIGGNLINSGTFTSGTGVVTFTNGQTASNTLTGATTFTNLTLNNTNGLVINSDATVTSALIFTSGIITTGANRLIVGSAGSAGTVTRTAGHVFGNLRRYVTNAAAPTVGYDIGDASNYTPVSVIFAGTVSGSGYLDVSTSAYTPPFASGLSQTKYINRKWTITNTSVAGFSSYSPSFTFVAGDKVGTPNTAALVIRKYSGTAWSVTTTGSQLALSTQATGLTSFSDFAIGEDACAGIALWLGSTSTDWNVGSNWCSGSIPTSSSNVEIPSAPTNQPIIGSAGGACNNITIDAGATLTMGGTYTLTVSGNWVNSGTFSAITSTVNFNGSFAQTISGTTTFSTLKVNNLAGLTLSSTATVNNLTIGDVVSGSVFNDGGFQLTGSGAFNLISGSFKLGSGATASTYPNFSSSSLGASTTVDYASSSAQTIAAVNYGNLSNSNNGNKTLASSGSIGIAGTFTPGTATYTITSSTVNFNGAGDQSIPALTYNNLNTSIGGTKTLGGAVIVNTVLTVGASSTIDLSSQTLTLAGSGTPLVINGAFTASTSTVTYSSSSPTNITAANYNNLNITGGVRTLASSGSIGIKGIFTPGSGSFTVSGSTIDFNGTGAQTLPSFNYNNLNISGARTTNSVTLASSGNIDVAGTFSPTASFSSGNYVNTGSTFNFSGANGQGIPAFNYNDLSSSNNNRVLAASGSIGIAGTFTPNAGSYTITSSTLDFNGSGSQSIPAFTYNNIKTSTGGSKTLGGTVTVTTVMTVGSSSTLDLSTHTLNLAGSGTPLLINGNFTASTSTVTYSSSSATNITAANYNNLDITGGSRTLAATGSIGIKGLFTPGSGAFTISGSTVDYNGTNGATAEGIASFTYNNLTISGSGLNNKAAAGNITVNAILNLSSANYSSTQGCLAMGTYTLSLTTSATTIGTGDVTGIIDRTQTFATNTFYTFGNINQGVIFPVVSGQTLPSSITLRVSIGSNPGWGGTPPSNITNRKYEMIHTGGSGNKAIYRVNYLDTELAGGVDETTLAIFSYVLSGDVVTDLGWSNYDATANYISVSNIDFATMPGTSLGDFQVSIAPTTAEFLTWNGSSSTDWNTPANWTPSGTPTSTIGVLIPDLTSITNKPLLPAFGSTQASCKFILISTGGVLNGGTATSTLTISDGVVGDAWGCEVGGAFNAGNSTVVFATTSGEFASISGSTNFYNLSVSSLSGLRPGAGSHIGIAGVLDMQGTLAAATNLNTIEYNGAAQTVVNPNGSSPGYSSLILSGSGIKTMPASAMNIAGNFSISGTATATAGGAITTTGSFSVGSGTSFTTGAYSHSIAGNFSNSGTFYATGSTVVLDGSSAQTISGTVATTFENLTINNSSGVSLTGINATVSNTLTFTNGKINTGANTVILGSSCNAGAITGAGSGKYINGKLRRFVPNASSPSVGYDIGDASNYTPVSIDFVGTTTGCGYLDASTAVSQPPVSTGLSQTKYINRKWTVTNTDVGFVSYNPSFSFVAGDEVGSPTTSALVIRKTDGTHWHTTTAGTQSATFTQAIGLTSFSDFTIGEDACSGIALWLGGTSTDWNDPTNWCSGSTPSSTVNVEIPAGTTYQPTIGSTGGLCNNILIDAGATLSMGGTYSLTVSGNWTNNGSFVHSTSIVNFNGSSAQTINGSNTFSTLKVNNAAGLTLSSSATVSNLTIGDVTANSIFNDGGFQLTASGTLNLVSGTFRLGGGATATTYPAFATNTIASGSTVDYAATSAQTIAAVNYSNLANSGNGDRTLASSGTIGISLAFTPGSGAYAISGSTVDYNGTTTQTITAFTYNNLTISGTGNNLKMAGGDITVNGILSLSSANFSSTRGALCMGQYPEPEYILYMGASATTTGIGDVNGFVNRNSFNMNTDYTFGNQFTLMNFTVGPLPGSVTLELYLTDAVPGWMSSTTGIKRYYDISRSGGSPATRLRFNVHYLDAELNGATEGTNLDLFDHHVSDNTTHDHGHADYNTTDNWVGFSNVGLAFLSTASLGDHFWTLGTDNTSDICTWMGGSPSGPTDWELPGNWIGGVPLSVSNVLIPGGLPNYPILPDAKTIQTLTIQNGGVLNATIASPTLTIAGGSWTNNGTLNAGSSTIVFATASSTISGSTDFMNLTVNGITLTPSTGSSMRVAGSISLSNSGILDAHTNANTIEYNGSSQTVLIPNGSTPGYSSLVLSGSGTKTLPGSAFSIAGNFSMSGTAAATALAAITTSGNFSIGNGTSFTTGSYTHPVGGNFSNSGSFTATGSTISFNGIGAQTIDGTTATTFNNLTIANSNGVSLSSINETINGSLTFSTGKLSLGAYDLLLGSSASIVSFDNSKYIVTDGSGALSQRVTNNTTDVNYPIGLASSYLPAKVQLTAGSTADDIKARVADGLSTSYDNNDVATGSAITSKVVNKTWFLKEAVGGGSSATITLQWNASDETSGFIRSLSDIGHYTEGSWVYAAGTAALGSDPYTQSLSGISSFSPFAVEGQNISCTVIGSPFCAGSAVTVDYVVSGGTWNSGNVFTAQLSDASGSFSSPVTIGTISSTTSGSISATLSSATSSGSGYRVRVVSSDPAGDGDNNGTDIVINGLPTISTGGTATAVCFSESGQSTSLAYSGTTNSPTTYSIDWDAAANIAGLSDQSSTSFSFSAGAGSLTGITIAAAVTSGTYSGTMTLSNENGCTNIQLIYLTVNPLPTPSITGVSAVCAGTTASIYSVSDVVGNTYSWTITGGTITAGGTTNSVTVSWGSAGAGTVNVIETISATSCFASAVEKSVAINTVPTVATASVSPSSVCG
ncbi:MAG: hypothetical protein WCO13_09975, partial [Bacteroidota bacterium]